MFKPLNQAVLILALLTSFVACKKENSSEAEIRSIIFEINKKLYHGIKESGTSNWQVNITTDVDLSKLPTPEIVVSKDAKHDKVGHTDFSSPVTYNVTSENGTKKAHKVTVSSNSSGKVNSTGIKSITFTVDSKNYTAVKSTGNYWYVTVPSSSDLSKLPSPSIVLSDGTTYDKVTQTDFSKDFKFTLSIGKTTQEHTIRVSKDGATKSAGKTIYTVSVTLNGKKYDATLTGNVWNLQLPLDADLTKLPTPNITVSNRATYQPQNHTNFSKPVTYTVTGEDGSTYQYSLNFVKVSWVKSNNKTGKDITKLSFRLGSRTYDGTINTSAKTVSATLPKGTNLKKLSAPIIYLSEGATISNPNTTDFSSPITYTVTAEDKSTNTYTLTVKEEVSQTVKMESIHFKIPVLSQEKKFNGVLNTAGEFVVTLPPGTNLSKLPAPYVQTIPSGATYDQVYKTDFSSPTTYTISYGGTTAKQVLKVQVATTGASSPTEAFVSKWKTSQDGEYIKLPLVQYGTYNFQVDWGDGNVNTITKHSEAYHKYDKANTYTVTIIGVIKGFKFEGFINVRYAHQLVEISQWGKLKMKSDATGDVGGMFLNDTKNLSITAKDTPDLTGVTSLSAMFYQAKNLQINSSIKSWDIVSIKDMSGMFLGSDYVGDLSTWDVSGVTKCLHFSDKMTTAQKPKFTCSQK